MTLFCLYAAPSSATTNPPDGGNALVAKGKPSLRISFPGGSIQTTNTRQHVSHDADADIQDPDYCQGKLQEGEFVPLSCITQYPRVF